ncbi:MAG: hypothetical protein GY903_34375 [Fuerstiella sp.]|nr:hypothetical protein [Fuerstiella sp.]MCP4859578.1 hypothetical protein [Fuerstiella sp.]
MDLILEIFGWLIYGFIGALFGVTWPPKSPTWARWQKIGIGFGVSAVATFLLSFGAAYFDVWGAAARYLFGLACLLMVGYMIVGNICRKYHESA